MGHIFRTYRAKIALSVIAGIASIAVSLYWNYILSGMINDVSSGNGLRPQKLIIVGIILLVMILVQTYKQLLSGYTCELINHGIRMWYAKRYVALEARQLEDINAGKELSKLQNEINEISAYISNNLLQRIDDLICFTTTFFWLVYLEWRLALFANLPVVLIMIYIAISSKIIGSLTTKRQQEAGNLNGLASTVIELFPLMKLYDAASLINRSYRTSIQNWENAGVAEEKTRARLMSFSALLSCIPLAILLLLGGKMVIAGTIELGTLYLFINLSGNVSGIMMNMPAHIAGFRRFIANCKRL